MTTPTSRMNDQAAGSPTSGGFGDHSLLDAARRIGDERLKEAVPQADGSISWHDGYARDFRAVPDAGIFNARVGEALFLAALYSVTKEEAYREAAMRAVEPLMRRLEDPSSCRALTEAIGLGFTGIGSIIYSCSRLALWLERQELTHGGLALASSVTQEVITSDDKLEVFWGTAGLLLALLPMSDAGARQVPDLLQTCGDHLLSRRFTDPSSGIRAWRTSAEAPEVGFAHGSTGVAYALLRLYRATHHRPYYDAAIEAFAFERTVYREDLANWPDYRGQEQNKMMLGWCHGAPGVGLSRLGAIGVVAPADEADIALDLMNALRTTAGSVDGRYDNLCCGNFGRIDFLLEAGLVLKNDTLVDQARAMAYRHLRRFPSTGVRIPHYGGEPHMEPGLWQGRSGVGYELLRVSDPRRFPSLLLLS